jgi:hypothetical protein
VEIATASSSSPAVISRYPAAPLQSSYRSPGVQRTYKS